LKRNKENHLSKQNTVGHLGSKRDGGKIGKAPGKGGKDTQKGTPAVPVHLGKQWPFGVPPSPHPAGSKIQEKRDNQRRKKRKREGEKNFSRRERKRQKG